jgi:hypothetical protein
MIDVALVLALALVVMAVANVVIWPPGVNRAISGIMTITAVVLAALLSGR